MGGKGMQMVSSVQLQCRFPRNTVDGTAFNLAELQCRVLERVGYRWRGASGSFPYGARAGPGWQGMLRNRGATRACGPLAQVIILPTNVYE